LYRSIRSWRLKIEHRVKCPHILWGDRGFGRKTKRESDPYKGGGERYRKGGEQLGEKNNL